MLGRHRRPELGFFQLPLIVVFVPLDDAMPCLHGHAELVVDGRAKLELVDGEAQIIADALAHPRQVVRVIRFLRGRDLLDTLCQPPPARPDGCEARNLGRMNLVAGAVRDRKWSTSAAELIGATYLHV